MLYDDPLHENRASDETQAFAVAVYAAAVAREREASAETVLS